MSKEFQKNNALIVDTSCFILLNKIGALPIIRSLCPNIVTTPEIANEFGEKLPEWVQIKEATNRSLQYSFYEKVDIGEASAITLAMELPQSLLVIDDLKGRKLAHKLDLKYTGSLGMLVVAKQQAIIPLLKPYLEKIKSTDFRVSPVLLQKIIDESGEGNA